MGKAWKFEDNLNTDEIIPARYNITIIPQELAKNVFCEIKPEYSKTVQPGDVIVGGQNFGCGSSREHAPWALGEFGFRVIIAPSFADIFANNCFKNGMLPITLTHEQVQEIMRRVQQREGYELTVDLERQTVEDSQGLSILFVVSEFQRYCLLEGLDDIGLTLRHEDLIREYEVSHG